MTKIAKKIRKLESLLGFKLNPNNTKHQSILFPLYAGKTANHIYNLHYYKIIRSKSDLTKE